MSSADDGWGGAQYDALAFCAASLVASPSSGSPLGRGAPSFGRGGRCEWRCRVLRHRRAGWLSWAEGCAKREQGEGEALERGKTRSTSLVLEEGRLRGDALGLVKLVWGLIRAAGRRDKVAGEISRLGVRRTMYVGAGGLITSVEVTFSS